MTEQSTVSQGESSKALKDTLAPPFLYLSSTDAGWEGLGAQACHEPMEHESCITPTGPGISLILFSGGGMRLEQRHANGPWHVRYIHQGDLILRSGASAPYESRWKNLSSHPTQTLHVHLRKDLLASAAREVADCDPMSLSLREISGFQDPLLAQVGFSLWRELEQPSPAGKVYARAATQMLIAHLLRHYTTLGEAMKSPLQGLMPWQINQVIDYIQAHLTQDLSLEVLAQQTGYSLYHFIRLFHQATGESPHQFVLHQRIARAQRLLLETDVSLAHVALESGFANQSHLTQGFKRHFGLTPRLYRQRHSIGAIL
jgi:AraC family transcriptional regulator